MRPTVPSLPSWIQTRPAASTSGCESGPRTTVGAASSRKASSTNERPSIVAVPFHSNEKRGCRDGWRKASTSVGTLKFRTLRPRLKRAPSSAMARARSRPRAGFSTRTLLEARLPVPDRPPVHLVDVAQQPPGQGRRRRRGRRPRPSSGGASPAPGRPGTRAGAARTPPRRSRRGTRPRKRGRTRPRCAAARRASARRRRSSTGRERQQREPGQDRRRRRRAGSWGPLLVLVAQPSPAAESSSRKRVASRWRRRIGRRAGRGDRALERRLDRRALGRTRERWPRRAAPASGTEP